MQHTVRKAQAGQVGPRALANMADGAARCGRSGMLRILVAALATAAKRRLSDFNPQDVANTAWAFATVNYRDEKLFAALARVAERSSRYAARSSSVFCIGAILMECEQRALRDSELALLKALHMMLETTTYGAVMLACEQGQLWSTVMTWQSELQQ